MSFNQANNHLAVHLHRVLSKEKENVFFSPFSISVAMSMLLCATEGQTAAEIRGALGHDHAGIKKDDVASICEQQISNILQHDDSYTLSCANSMLSQKGFEIKDEYKQILSKCFKALMLEVDFANEIKMVINQINEWVKQKTNNMIPNFVKSLNPSSELVLLNAVYFKGTWIHQFEKNRTIPRKFYNNGIKNNAKKVETMHLNDDDDFPFYENKTLQVLQLPYIGDEVAMMILLPREKDGIDSVEASLSSSFVQEFKEKLKMMEVKIALPRFRLEYSKSLVSCFQELGVNLIFLPGAELTHLSDSSGLFVTEILHKTVLNVNEAGTEAAAVTMVEMSRSAPVRKPEFIVDHPFMLVIYNTKNDLILFMGRINEL